MEIQRNLVEKKLVTVAEQIAVQEMAAPSKMIRAALDYINFMKTFLCWMWRKISILVKIICVIFLRKNLELPLSIM